MKVNVRKIVAKDIPECADVLATIPEWFGLPESNKEYLSRLEALDGCVAEIDGSIAGFAGLLRHGDFSVEIDVIAVDRKYHRSGIGKQLIQFIESEMFTSKTKLFHMKTIAPSKDDANYAETRKFWMSMGFIPLEENDLWDDFNPCLMMVKPV